MDTQVRREAVAALLAGDPLLSGRSIAARLNVSQTTIRRDLAWLARNAEVAQPVPQAVSSQVRSGDSQRLVAALDAELAESAKAAGKALVWSAAEADIIGMIAAEVDRRVELSAQYAATTKVDVKLKLATEIRLLESSIARLYRQVSTEVAAPMSAVSRKAQHAANSRWNRHRMGEGIRAT
jgi:predicted kinase